MDSFGLDCDDMHEDSDADTWVHVCVRLKGDM